MTTLRKEGSGRPIAPGAAPRALRLTSDWIAVRETPPKTLSNVLVGVVSTPEPGTVMQGVIESVGPGKLSRKRVLIPCEVEVGMTVMFPAEAGRARLPWDYSVRIMRESELSGVVEV